MSDAERLEQIIFCLRDSSDRHDNGECVDPEMLALAEVLATEVLKSINEE
jgi:hypothetical protein